MRLIVECEHGHQRLGWHLTTSEVVEGVFEEQVCSETEFTDPDAILAALAEAGVLEVERGSAEDWVSIFRYVSPWKEAK